MATDVESNVERDCFAVLAMTKKHNDIDTRYLSLRGVPFFRATKQSQNFILEVIDF